MSSLEEFSDLRLSVFFVRHLHCGVGWFLYPGWPALPEGGIGSSITLRLRFGVRSS